LNKLIAKIDGNLFTRTNDYTDWRSISLLWWKPAANSSCFIRHYFIIIL